MSVEQKEVEFDQDIFDQMLSGTFEESASDEEVEDNVEDEADTAEDLSEDGNEDQEDTDQEDESEDEEELDEDGDGDLDEDLETEDEDEEEDSLVDDNDSDDEAYDAEGDEDEDSDDEGSLTADEDIDEESEEEADTEEDSDGDTPDTDGIDYKAFYDKVVNTEFVVNGKKVKGFSDPQKIIQSQQMAGGFSEKMAGFKQYRPFMAPLKDRGMLEDQAKFDLAMNLIDGDKEAIKQHLKSLEIEPLDLDMDQIDYKASPTTASQEALIIEDVMAQAKGAGIEDQVRQVVGNEWDAESFQEFVSNDAVRNDLLQHIESGAYTTVQDKMAEMSRLDYNGRYNSMNTISKYRAAVTELQKEYQAQAPQEQAQEQKAHKKASVSKEKAKITDARKQAAYKEKATKREAQLAKQRKKAASMSKKKPKAKPATKKAFDPMELEGEEFDKHMDFLMTGGR